MNKGVRFLKAMTPYMPGSLALLPVADADRMILEGFAVPHVFPDRPFAVDASAPLPPAEPAPPRRLAQVYKTKRVI